MKNASERFKSDFECRNNLYSSTDNNYFDLYANGFFLNQMLLSCKFNGLKCDLNDFYYFHDYFYGSCYQFNGLKVNNASDSNSSIKSDVKKIQKPGPENGLQLELFVGNPRRQQQFNFKGGVRLVVHDKHDRSFPNDHGIDVSVGQSTNVAINRHLIKHKGKPYTQCIDPNDVDWESSDVLSFMKNNYHVETYDQNFCLKACQQIFLLDRCCCYNLEFPLKV